MNVIKRDCTEVPFNKEKISNAIMKAMPYGEGIKEKIALRIAEEVEQELLQKQIEEVEIYIIESMVFDKLIKYKQKNTAKAYEGYRQVREYQRYVQNSTDEDLINLLDGTNEYLNKENSNKDAKLVTTQRDYMAGIMSKDITKRFLMPPDILQADEEGIIHFHDMDYFGQKALHNCDLINLEDMLQNGTVINGVRIDKPHRFLTACTVATQIITAVASSQYGGCTISLSHLAPFVKSSYDIAYNKYIKRGNSNLEAEKYAMEDLTKEIEDGVQTFNYQINSMSTTNGQAPFLSVFMYLGETKEYKQELAMIIEEFLKQRIQGMKNKVGVYVTQTFPKLLYVLEEDNIHENSPYWYLTKLSAQCTAKRLVPDYISEKKMKELKEGNCFPNMGCRSFLAPWKDEQGNYKFYGRFNQGVVTINLPDVAFSSDGNMDKFWNILENRCELCHRALMLRHKRLLGTSSDVAPVLWQDGALARLNQHEPIDKLLFGGYSSISLGYAGLYECVKYMTKQSHSNNDKGHSFGIEIMQYLNNKCEQWKKQDNLGYSLYGSPIESTTYKFAKKLKERFGNDIFVQLDGKDRNYITNSYHIPVFEEINPFDKLSIESKFQELSLGGAISYIECADLTHNVQAVLNIIKFIYDNIMHAELNTKSDYCQVCGYDGEIKIIDENGELIWECPNCKNRDHSKMNVARRTCGYIGSNFWNDGRTDEIAHRFVHLDNHEIK
nr:MAG TPA: anaerobic ribonucleoside triphosphate reductase [Bacteriophage sp.]